jgi:carbon monoxide dehydrogenase subunit G
VVEEMREVSDFAGVSLSGGGRLSIELGERETLRIEADDNLLAYIETEVRDGRLELGVREGVNLRPTQPVRFYVTVKELNAIAVSGSGKVRAPDLEEEHFSVSISGSGEVRTGDLNASSLRVAVSGSGELELAGGEVNEQDISISGSGRVEASDLRCGSAKVAVSGSGGATVWATEGLDVRISGSGSVGYYGDPHTMFSTSGSGKISSLGNR